MKNYWILMADVRDSSQKEGDTLMNQFQQLVSDANQRFGSQILSPLSITLGDEFQGVVKDIEAVRDLIYYFDEELLTSDPHFDLRFVANFGPIDTAINSETSYGMLGDGLTEARKRLNTLKKSEEAIQVSGTGDNAQDRALTLAFRWYRSLYSDWPAKDRAIAQEFIQGKDYKQVATAFDRDPSSMWRKGQTLKIKDFFAARELITLLINNGQPLD